LKSLRKEAAMRKSIVFSVVVALQLCVGTVSAPSLGQPPNPVESPTFYHLVPGTYVNGWPRFTIHYPKEWVERQPMPQEVFRASAPGPLPYPALIVAIVPNSPSLGILASSLAKRLGLFNTEVTIVSDKPSQLRDGTPVQEFEIHMLRNGAPFNSLNLATQKGDLVRMTAVESVTEKTGGDLKAILYSIEFDPSKDEPVKVPPDVEEFLNRHNNDLLSHDLA
jgi:hypothetical protein